MKYNKLDKKIINIKDDFVSIIKGVVSKTLNLDLTFSPHIKNIYVDLNSVLSIVFRYEDINSSEIEQFLSDVIEKFLTKHTADGKTIYLLYTLKPSKVHRSIYEGWCHDRETRVIVPNLEFIKRLLVAIKVMESKDNHIRVVNCRDIHPAMVVYTIDRNSGISGLVVSKDSVFKCLRRPLIVYTGVYWIELESEFLPDGRAEIPDPYNLASVYFTICGDARNEFKGIKGYGPAMTKKFIEANKLKIMADLNYPMKEEIVKNLPLYDIDLMLAKAKELSLDLEQFKKL